jgi:glycine cleavage system pyridoxal-binding protein P
LAICAAFCKRHEKENIVNKTIFEEKWSVIRTLLTAKWSLMVEYDLNKVDKAEVKFDKFVTMLQVKYGYTRQEARDKIGILWAEYEANNKIRT